MKNWKYSWKSVTDKDYIDSIMIFWKFFKENYQNVFVYNACHYEIRLITLNIGRGKEILSSEAASKSTQKDEHHLVEAKQFLDEFKYCVDNKIEFTRKDAKSWLIKARNIYVTKPEHNILHSKVFKDYRKNNPTENIIKVLEKFGIILI